MHLKESIDLGMFYVYEYIHEVNYKSHGLTAFIKIIICADEPDMAHKPFGSVVIRQHIIISVFSYIKRVW